MNDYESKRLKWLRCAALHLLLCLRTFESLAAVSSLETASVAVRASGRAQLIRSHVNSEASVQSHEEADLETGYPIKPRVVQIFYESLCPDSAKTIAEKSTGLWSSYNTKGVPRTADYHDDKSIWRFDLYPFGNAQRDHFNRVRCQNGPEECKGNSYHQCALKELNTSQSFAVIDCFMDIVHEKLNGGTARGYVSDKGAVARMQEAGDERGQDMHLLEMNGSKPMVWSYGDTTPEPTGKPRIRDFKKEVADPCWGKLHAPHWQELVETCYNADKTKNELQDYYETETHRLNFSWVPAVFINGTFNYEASHGFDLLTYLD